MHGPQASTTCKTLSLGFHMISRLEQTCTMNLEHVYSESRGGTLASIVLRVRITGEFELPCGGDADV